MIQEDYDSHYDALDYTADYLFDLVGNRVEKRTDTDGDSIVDEVISYLYDDNDRLLVESLDSDGDTVIDQTTVYENGPNAVNGSFGGDWTVQTKKTVWQGTDTDPGTGTKLSETTSSYNLQGRLEQVEIDSDGDGTPDSTSSYTYNDSGIRTSQTVDGATTDYVIDTNNHTGYAQVLEERNGTTGVVEKTYTLGHDVISQQAPADASESALFLLPDGHGSTRKLVDATGQPLVGEVYRYDAYGNPIGFDPSTALTTFLYSGEQTDRATGQQYLRARYYDMATGRFNRLDPFAGNLEDPLSLHKYLYAHDDPTNKSDPTGLFSINSQLSVSGISNNIITGTRFLNTAFRVYARVNKLMELLDYARTATKLLRSLQAATPAGAAAALASAIRQEFSGARAANQVLASFTEVLETLGPDWPRISKAITRHATRIAAELAPRVAHRIPGYLAAQAAGRFRIILFLPTGPGGRGGDRFIRVGDEAEVALGLTGGRLFGFGIRKGAGFDQLYRIDYWDVSRPLTRRIHVHYHLLDDTQAHPPGRTIWEP